MEEETDVFHKFVSAASFYNAFLDVNAVYEEVRKEAQRENISFSQALMDFNFPDGTTLALLFSHIDSLKRCIDEERTF